MTHYDVVIVGGGHNGLVSAAYLAKAGLKVLILERQGQLGGAVQSLQVFKGVAARLSRYSYLLSLFPQKISDDLGLRFESRRRAVASFTPTVRDGAHKALLISNTDEQRTLESFRQLTGSDSEYHAFQRFNHLMEVFAEKVWPTLLQPMVTREAMQARFDDAESQEAWEMLVEQPLGVGLERILQDDRVRGLAFTNAKIGVLTQPHDPTLLQNRTYIYHIIGQGTGEWRVVVGGMGAVSEALEQCARQAGVEIIRGAAVERIDAQTGQVHYTRDGRSFEVEGAYVLANVAPSMLEVMLGRPEKAQIDPGAVFKINMVLKRLPRLKAAGYSSAEAFTGTFHMDEGYEAMKASFQQATQGLLPDQPPGEMYCQTMTDPSTLAPELAAQGYHTITLFGIDIPVRAFHADNEGTRAETLGRYVKAINQYLDEPLEDCLAVDSDGQACIEAKTPLDLETELGLPQGNIFHKNLTWPFADDAALGGTWGVETEFPRLLICGSGAWRGGCVSGVPGHNAAMKVLEAMGRR